MQATRITIRLPIYRLLNQRWHLQPPYQEKLPCQTLIYQEIWHSQDCSLAAVCNHRHQLPLSRITNRAIRTLRRYVYWTYIMYVGHITCIVYVSIDHWQQRIIVCTNIQKGANHLLAANKLRFAFIQWCANLPISNYVINTETLLRPTQFTLKYRPSSPTPSICTLIAIRLLIYITPLLPCFKR